MKRTLKMAARPTGLLIIIAVLLSCGGSKGDFSSHRKEGIKAYEAGDYNKALNHFRSAFLLEPSDRDNLFDLGRTYKKMSLLDSALAYFRRARLLYSNDREINKQVLDLCVGTDDNKTALQAIASLIATGDNERMYWPLLAELNYRDGNYQSAAHYYNLLVADEPKRPNYYLLLSGTLAQMGDFSQSNAVLEKAVQVFGPSAEFFANMGINFLNMKDRAKAEEYMRMSLQLAPDNPALWVNLANILSEEAGRSKKKEALEIYKKYRDNAPAGFRIDSLILELEAELR
jgi:tetratricopeptide (TPR) repeat protein